MRASGTCSDAAADAAGPGSSASPGPARSPRRRPVRPARPEPAGQRAGGGARLLAGLVLCLGAVPAEARTFAGQAEALRLAFPDSATIVRQTLYLTETQVGAVERAAQARLPSRVVPYYVGRTGARLDGWAFFDTHMVRTMPETVMVVIAPDGTVRAVELLAFHEPEEYAPPERWRATFRGRALDGELWVRRGLRNVTGATLTSHAVTAAVRRSLALWALVAKDTTP
jgi:hypothetical protein